MNETAINWFVDELQRAEWIPKDSVIMNSVILMAKEIEKEQIIKAFNVGEDVGDRRNYTGEKYFECKYVLKVE